MNSFKSGLESALHAVITFEKAIERDIEIDFPKIAIVLIATLESIQTEFCTDVGSGDKDFQLSIKGVSDYEAMKNLSTHLVDTLASGESNFCKGVGIAIEVLKEIDEVE